MVGSRFERSGSPQDAEGNMSSHVLCSMMEEKCYRIPRTFYDDHSERDLPTPRAVRETKRYVWICRDDPALPELLDDARYYADTEGLDLDVARRLGPAAKALLRAVNV